MKGALKTKAFHSISAVGKRNISFSYHQIYGGFMKRIILGFMLLALSGCGSGGGKTAGVPDGTPLGALNSSAAKSTPLAAGDIDCPTGGILVQTGIDKNGNGTLDASEVTSSQKVCNGAQGATGTTGTTGTAGAAGVTGAIGPQGATGATGLTGLTGTSGTTGATGAVGATGATGSQGVQGVAGLNGSQGATGATGPTGAQGLIGLTGATGSTGAAGSNGLAGATGATGAQGIQGATGAQGIAGLDGAMGATGLTGATGSTGATGAAGLTGPTGATGAIGATGATGPAGISASSLEMTSSIHCAGDIQQPQTLYVFHFNYDAAIFSSGFVLVSGSISYIGSQNSGSGFYVPTHTDWATGPVTFIYDLAYSYNNGSWRLTLNRTTNIVSIKYYDYQLDYGFHSWEIAPDKCVVTTY